MTAIGGPEGIRTPDLLHAMEALFQLRYRPMPWIVHWYIAAIDLLSIVRCNGRPDVCYVSSLLLYLLIQICCIQNVLHVLHIHTHCSQVSSVKFL